MILRFPHDESSRIDGVEQKWGRRMEAWRSESRLGISLVTVLALALGWSSALADILTSSKISASSGAVPVRTAFEDYFGESTTSLGDANGDGTQDLAVGAIFADGRAGDPDTGAFWILSLDETGAVVDTVRIDDVDMGGVLHYRNRFGQAIAFLGDLDGSGGSRYALAVGASYDNNPVEAAGAVWILFFDENHILVHKTPIREGTPGFTGDLDAFDNLGTSIAVLGDLDGAGGGATTLAVTAPGDDDGCPGTQNEGAVYLVSIRSDGTPASSAKISATDPAFGGRLDCGDFFGEWVCSLQDFDGPGGSAHTIAVGAIFDDDTEDAPGDVQRGAVWILGIAADLSLMSAQKISDTEGGFVGVLDDNDNFGSAIAARDLDEDGTLDLLVGAANDDDSHYNAGAIWVLYLRPDGSVRQHEKISELRGGFSGPLGDSDVFGASIGFLGDLDHDGREEVAVGASLDDDTANGYGGHDSGAVYVVSLPNLGVCCYSHNCQSSWEWSCDFNTGSFQDGASSCSACGQPELGACCFGNACFELARCACEQAGGLYLGDGVACMAGGCQTVDVADPPSPPTLTATGTTWLGPISPNPGAGLLLIPVRLGAPAKVRVELLEVSGRRIAERPEVSLSAGTHALVWRPLAGSARALANGVYIVRATAGASEASATVVMTAP